VNSLIAIGALVVLVIAGGIAYGLKSRRVGKLEAEIKALKEGGKAHEREHEAITDHAAVGDINDDASVVRELGDG